MLTAIMTGQHTKRVAGYSLLIGKEIGLSEAELGELVFCASVHDVGKLGVPEHILAKPGPLSVRERRAVEMHTLIGAELLLSAKSHPEARNAALTHHERWSGGGYPRGLKGEDIPLFGRIIAIADVFDALVSERCYKSALPEPVALSIIRRERGGQFDPHLVSAFLRSLPPVFRLQ